MNSLQHPKATTGRRLIPSAEYKARRGGISEMSRWREQQAGTGPQPVKIGGRNYYFEDEVDAFFSALATARSQNGEHAVGEGDTQDCLAERKSGPMSEAAGDGHPATASNFNALERRNPERTEHDHPTQPPSPKQTS